MNSINSWLIKLFCAFWALLLFLDYANYSGYFTQAFTYFEYSGLLAVALLFSGIFIYIFTKRDRSGFSLQVNNYRNIYSYLFLLVFMGLIMSFYVSKTGVSSTIGGSVLLFILKSVGFHLAALFIVAAAFSTGSFLLNKCGIILSGVSRFLVSLAFGFLIITLCLFLFGSVGLLLQPVIIIFILLLLIPGWKNVLEFIKMQVVAKVPSFKLHLASFFSYGMILFLMALNFCYITRPFPVGFDDLNLYMNIPKLIAGYGALTKGGDAYNWSIMMSLGFIMYKSAAVAILVSVIPGVLSLILIYQISRKMAVSREWSLFACALFYTLPNIIWQSRNDAKVDLALTFITLSVILLMMEFYFVKTKEFKSIKIKRFKIEPEIAVWSLCGLLVGYAFGIKYTSMLCVFGFMVYLFYVTAGKWAAIGMFFFNFAIIFGLKLTRFAAFEAESGFLALTPMICSLIFFGMAVKMNRLALIRSVKLTILFSSFIGITFIPWAAKHLAENKSLSFESILTGKSPLPELYPEMKGGIGYHNQGNGKYKKESIEIEKGMYLFANALIPKISLAGFNFFSNIQKPFKLLSETTIVNTSSDINAPQTEKKSKYTDKYEEIRRYLGYESGIIRFVSLPYDLAMKTNVRLWSADTGILFIIIIPLFMFVYKGSHLAINFLKFLLILFILISCMLSVEMFAGPYSLSTVIEKLKSNSFADAELFQFLKPVYVTLKQPLLITGNALLPVYNLLTVQSLGLSFMMVMLFSVIFYFLFVTTLSRIDKNSKLIIATTFSILISWMILSSGIFWYGMAGFALLTIVVVKLIHQNENETSRRFLYYLIPVCALTWFILILPFQFMPIRFTMVRDMSTVDFKSFIDKPFANYAIGVATEKEVYKQFFQPAELNILNQLNNDKKAGILNVSTFLTYHIINNDLRVHADNQLGIFDHIYTVTNGDRSKIISELKRVGIKYVLVSLHTPTLDMTPEKSLTKKFNNLMQSLVNNPGARVLYTNRIVERPDGNMDIVFEGKQIKAMNQLAGLRVIEQGSVAMFEIF